MSEYKKETPLERYERLAREADRSLEALEGYAFVFIPAFIIFGLIALAVIAYVPR